MSLQSKRWKIAAPVGEDYLVRFPGLDPLIMQLLHNRGIQENDQVRAFLDGEHEPSNPFHMKGVPDAVALLRQAIRRGDQIAVYGDFDADGVTATALLVEVLSAAGARVEPYIPHRVDEGYGLNLDSLRSLYRNGVRVVVTADCGIRAVEEVAEARKGMTMIITDHHSVGNQLPPASAVIDPNQADCQYPFKKLSGVGVAYNLARAFLLAQAKARSPVDLDEESLLDLVALGTVADMVPLVGENRYLVRRGLQVLNAAKRPGVEALMADASVRRGQVDAMAIGFRLAPRLNAAGRLDTAMLAYRLLTSRDALETRELAVKLGRLNSDRQELTSRTVDEAEAQVRAGDPDARLLLVIGDSFLPGIVGLAAGRLTQATYRPSVVVELGEDFSRGSCRSIPEFNITDALDECADLLVRYGGHAEAAGFTVATENLDELGSRLLAIAAHQLADVDLQPVLHIDCEIPLEEVNEGTLGLLNQLEPCGMANPHPVLVTRNLTVRDRRTVGSDQSHLKLALRDRRGAHWDAIAFGWGAKAQQIPARVDVAFRLGLNEWNHRSQLQLLIEDIRASET